MDSMSDADFRGARIRAFFLRVLGALSGHSRDLLAFEFRAREPAPGRAGLPGRQDGPRRSDHRQRRSLPGF